MKDDEAMVEPRSCCAPSRDSGNTPIASPFESALNGELADRDLSRLVSLPGGEFLMGSEDDDAWVADGEGPIRTAEVAAFYISPTAVSNAEFTKFVAETGYVTEAEKFGFSFVFAGLLPDDFPETRGVIAAPWWREVSGACWRRPEGLHSDIDGRLNHPVVHVSRNDADAYCGWAGMRLPTETEWEYAARGGLVQARYPWGNELLVDGRHMCNIWQGEFPATNTGEDGWIGTAPVDSYEPNGYGLFNMAGNAWEWCSDRFNHFIPNPLEAPDTEHYVIRGGSYLCHESYCNRYRVAARTSSTAESSTGNMGFRVAFSR